MRNLTVVGFSDLAWLIDKVPFDTRFLGPLRVCSQLSWYTVSYSKPWFLVKGRLAFSESPLGLGTFLGSLWRRQINTGGLWG